MATGDIIGLQEVAGPSFTEVNLNTLYVSITRIREAHASATTGVNCDMTWNTAFADTNYTYTINGFDSLGNPVEISLISKAASKIVVKTLINATLTAIAMPYGT
jgi:hypothetical protein